MKKTIFTVFAFFVFITSVNAKEMITLTDMAGRKVTVPKKVERIVALSGSLRFIVYLQAFDKVAGIEGVEKQSVMRGNPATGKAYWLAIKDKVENIPTIGEGGPGKLPDFEKLITIKPDLVITLEPDNAELIQNKTGIPAIVIKQPGLEDLKIKELHDAFTFLGKILGREKRAEELITYSQNLVKDLKKRTSKSYYPTVYIGAISARGPHGLTSTQGMFAPLNWLNVKNVADETGKAGAIFIDKEKLLVWNPKYLFIDSAGFALVNDDYLKHKDFYKKLQAVKEQRAYSLFPNNFYRANIEILFANTFFMGKVIYPDQFRDIVPEKKAREIFIKFLGKDVFDELKGAYGGFRKIEFKESGLTIQ